MPSTETRLVRELERRERHSLLEQRARTRRDVRHLAVRASRRARPTPRPGGCGTRARRRAPRRRGRGPSGHGSPEVRDDVRRRSGRAGRPGRRPSRSGRAPRRARGGGRAVWPAISNVGSPSASRSTQLGVARAPGTACGCRSANSICSSSVCVDRPATRRAELGELRGVVAEAARLRRAAARAGERRPSRGTAARPGVPVRG